MLKDITLGQFFPGTSLAHRLDPRTKLILTLLYIVGLFCAKSFLSYGLMIALLAVSIKVSGVAPKALPCPAPVVSLCTSLPQAHSPPHRSPLSRLWLPPPSHPSAFARTVLPLLKGPLSLSSFDG